MVSSRRQPHLFVVLAIVLLVTYGAGARTLRGTSARAQDVSVLVGDNFYDPNAITVQAGTTVTWTNNGTLLHTVTSDTGAFDSQYNLSPGTSYSVTFADAGVYGYHCLVHGTIQSGTVTVEGSPTVAPTLAPTAPPTEPPTATLVPTPTFTRGNPKKTPTAAATGSPSPGATATPVAEGGGGGSSGTILLVAGALAAAVMLAGVVYYAVRRMRGTL